MTDISLRTFVHKALETDGVLRIAKGTTDEIVNKGTIGNRLATFLREVGEELGLVRPNQPERNQRQQQALEAFREALTGHYGSTVANLALAQTGLDQDGTVLTSTLVLQANRLARQEMQRIRQDNLQSMQDFAALSPGEDASPGFARIAGALEPPLDPNTLSDKARSVYTSRLALAVQVHSDLGRKSIDPAKMEEIAKQTLKDVSRLDAKGQLDEAQQARSRHTKAMYNVLVAIDRSESPRVLLEHLRTAQIALNKVTDIELAGKDVGGEDLQSLNEEALMRAMRDYPPDRRSKLQEALGRALDRDGALHALNVASLAMLADVQGGTELDLQLNSDRMASVGSVFNQTMSVTRVISKVLSPITSDTDSDLMRLSDKDNISEQTRQQAKTALDDLYESIPRRPSPDELLLQFIEKTFPPPVLDIGDVPDWDDVRVQGKVEEMVRDDMGLRGEPLGTVVDRFRNTIDSNDKLAPGLAAKIHAALNAMVEEEALHQAMQNVPSLKDLAKEDIWRLFVPGQNKVISKWDFEHHGEGSLAGLYRGMRTMLESQARGEVLDGPRLESLHQVMTENTFRGQDLRLSYKSDVVNAGIAEQFREQARIPQGYRAESTNLALELGVSVSEDGREELRKITQQGAHVERLNETKDMVDVILKVGDPIALRTFVDDTLRTARDQFEKGNDDLNRAVIAKAVQDIYRAHPFMDGNTRTIVFTAMNALLIEAGMGPAILEDPRFVAGHSLEEFIQDIAKGQEAFRNLVG